MAATTGTFLARLGFSTPSAIVTGANNPINVDLPAAQAITAFANGTAAGQVNLGWFDSRTLTATSVTLDLTALAAASTNTGAAAFSAVVAYRITNDAAVDSANNLTIGNAASTQFAFNGVGSTSTQVLKPGQELLIKDVSTLGMVCSTNKNWKFDAGSGTVPFTLEIVGRA